jgi:hypothetical protein
MLSVNPVKEKKASAAGYSVKNSAIREFNRKLKAAFPSRYINSFSYLLKNGIETTDGIHYHTATYTSLYHYIIEKIG